MEEDRSTENKYISHDQLKGAGSVAVDGSAKERQILEATGLEKGWGIKCAGEHTEGVRTDTKWGHMYKNLRGALLN